MVICSGGGIGQEPVPALPGAGACAALHIGEPGMGPVPDDVVGRVPPPPARNVVVFSSRPATEPVSRSFFLMGGRASPSIRAKIVTLGFDLVLLVWG